MYIFFLVKKYINFTIPVQTVTKTGEPRSNTRSIPLFQVMYSLLLKLSVSQISWVTAKTLKTNQFYIYFQSVYKLLIWISNNQNDQNENDDSRQIPIIK